MGKKHPSLLSLIYKETAVFKWHVIDATNGKVIAQFKFPLHAEAFMYFKPFLVSGIDAVPKRSRDFFEVQ
jgi:hypothetical protein